jgi:hypothetical protein
MDAMPGIIMEFDVPRVLGDAAQQRNAHGAGGRAAGDREAYFLAPAHGEQSQCADGIVEFIDYLKYPLHLPKSRCMAYG